MGSMAEPQERCPCEGEDDCPAGAPGNVEDGETVIRFVQGRNDLEWHEGEAFLKPSAFGRDELDLRRDKSASLLRDEHTAHEETGRRASARGRNGTWPADPVLARAPVSEIRAMLDDTDRREACVHANPITDQLGFCPTHAYVRRSYPPLDPEQRLAMNAFREKLARRFSDIRHHSGAAVLEPPETTP